MKELITTKQECYMIKPTDLDLSFNFTYMTGIIKNIVLLIFKKVTSNLNPFSINYFLYSPVTNCRGHLITESVKFD